MNQLPFETIHRKVLIKREAVRNFGINPEDRDTKTLINYGIVNIDKPSGPTSHQISDYVKRILKISKAGHSGTLDPHVTGVLPVALARATRVVQILLSAGKEYVALMYLHRPIEEIKIRKAFDKFTGKIMQKPPVKSAVRRINRPRKIYYIDIIEIQGQNILFKIGCQAGTYIRKYIHDLGQKLGCGAHMVQLRRTRVAAFDESTLTTLHDLTDAFHYYKNENNDKFIRKIIQPMENAVRHIPKVWVLDTTIMTLTHGRDLAVPGISKIESCIKPNNITAIMTLKGELIGLGIAQMTSEDIIKKDRGIAFKTDKVFMQEIN
ncbi:MAG: RNA-guided pseudouridylation complex pseudouridine synthase subunit Cbf5 [Nanoarchaeota archaeon]|nr:RNA-guided pseudouridylation complex pseudouridine synthase subunit Cbf5 [Nanoarchaeota archaeon]MBU1004900.1 RNA-guided pseudouridylation complex pseudouridine synthase subunit Cbf5 [Nanoarchaeota archaeon]MBU1946550.1 RNA-guided pseudouridylation complex pseudouridine synthase subunit Cbf5 [Nanoarchaeota archaeon]